MSIERFAAQQLQVNARGFAHLGGAARLDPALGGDADAAHAPQQRHQLEVHLGEELDGSVIEGGEVPLKRPAAGRLEVQEQQPLLRAKPVAGPLEWELAPSMTLPSSSSPRWTSNWWRCCGGCAGVCVAAK